MEQWLSRTSRAEQNYVLSLGLDEGIYTGCSDIVFLVASNLLDCVYTVMCYGSTRGAPYALNVLSRWAASHCP